MFDYQKVAEYELGMFIRLRLENMSIWMVTEFQSEIGNHHPNLI